RPRDDGPEPVGGVHAHGGDRDGRAGEPHAAPDGGGGAARGAPLRGERDRGRRGADRGLLRGRPGGGAPGRGPAGAAALRGAAPPPGRRGDRGLLPGGPRLLAVGQGPLRRDHGGAGRRLAHPGGAQPRGGGAESREPAGDRVPPPRRDRGDGAAGRGAAPGGRRDPGRRGPDRGAHRLHHGVARGEPAGRGAARVPVGRRGAGGARPRARAAGSPRLGGGAPARRARAAGGGGGAGGAVAGLSGLEAALRERIRGEVRFDPGSRALYATDASNYRQAPIGVVIPRDLDDVIHAVAAAREHGAPVLSRGGGTSLAGQCCNAALLLDFSKYLHRVLEIDPDRRLARVEPGCVLDDLRRPAEPHGLTFAPDPATHTHCTLGGMLGNNSCGVHSLLAAQCGLGLRTSDNTHELVVLTYDGLGLRVGATGEAELAAAIGAGGRRGGIYAALAALRDRYADEIRRRFPRLPRRVSGYNLDELLLERGFHLARALVGTEGTCVTILEATLHL